MYINLIELTVKLVRTYGLSWEKHLLKGQYLGMHRIQNLTPHFHCTAQGTQMVSYKQNDL